MSSLNSLGIGTVFILGLSFGAGPCTLSCLPFLGPVFMAGNHHQRWRTIVPFSLGRLTGYSSLGGIAASISFLLEDWLASAWPGAILGYATLFLAMILVLKPKQLKCSLLSAHQSEQTVEFVNSSPAFSGSLYLLGISMTLNPCAPLTIVTAAAAASSNIGVGILFGFSFGLGAVILPSIMLTFAISHFTESIRIKLSQWQSQLEVCSVLMLIILGTASAFSWITL